MVRINSGKNIHSVEQPGKGAEGTENKGTLESSTRELQKGDKAAAKKEEWINAKEPRMIFETLNQRGSVTAKKTGDEKLGNELAKRRLTEQLRPAGKQDDAAKTSTASAAGAGFGDVIGAAGEAIGDALKSLEPDHNPPPFRWVTGPWLNFETILDDQEPEAHRNRIGDQHRPGGWTLIGVEAGLLRFLDINLEEASNLGRIYVSGAIDFVKVQAEIFGDIGKGKGLSLRGVFGGQVLAELIGAHYEVGYDTPKVEFFGRDVGVELTARLDAAVHAYARAWLEVSVGMRNAVMIGGKAFAGASATLSGKAELAPFADIHGSVTAWAGTGAEFIIGVEADLETGEFTVQQSAGAALPYGLSYDWGVSVNVAELSSLILEHDCELTGLNLSDAPQQNYENWKNLYEHIVGQVDSVANFAAGEEAKQTGSQAAGAAAGLAGNVAAGAEDAAEGIANGLGDAAQKIFGWFN
jgi:hypothetical protein